MKTTTITTVKKTTTPVTTGISRAGSSKWILLVHINEAGTGYMALYEAVK